MNDFISLICPNCGGTLEISKNTLSFKCSHCGVEHLVRHEAGTILLESFARCPICNRNDKVEKVSAVVNNRSSKFANLISPPPKPIEPSLPQEPIKPTADSQTSGYCLIWIFLGLLLIYILTPCDIKGVPFYINEEGNWAMGDFMAAIGLYLVALIILVLFIESIKRGGERNQIISEKKKSYDEAVKKYEEDYEKYQIAMKKFPRQIELWEKAVENWKKLYYCSRDDIVFDPKTQKYCEPDKINELIFVK